jgi:Periplasmic glycine betaine/choline-binding (lipo)protein of an ABC-type transport system (osmoprotectant binding protein)
MVSVGLGANARLEEKEEDPMRSIRALALGASLLVLFSACSTGGGSKPTIKIGSDGFDEARVMAEIYAQTLEANGYTVDRAGIGLGARKVTSPALESGQIDLKPEYIGSGLSYYEAGKQTGDPAANAAALQTVLTTKGGGITVLGYTPGQDTNAFVVRPETATTLKLAKLSDVGPVQDQLKWGLATDCPTNPVCAAALKTAYGIAPKDVTPLSACDQPMADALKAKTIDVAELCSTQPDILINGWVVLDDDKHTQPADNIAPLVRNDYLAKVDKAAFQKLLDAVSAKIDTKTLADLYKQVTTDKKDTAVVAKAWLQANGFVK